MSGPRQWVEGMREISGFGGDYEAMCRKMLLAGVAWLDAHPDETPVYRGFKNVFGIASEDNEAAVALTEAIVAPTNGDCTGAMHYACVNHCLFIRANGWEAYVRKMSEP